MAWAFEFKAGLGWAAVVTLLTIIGMWAALQMKSVVPFLLPVVTWIGFVVWVERSVKK